LPGGAEHRLLGWPRHVQGDVLPELVLEHFDRLNRRYEDGELEAEAENWRLLLQIEADERLGGPVLGDGVYFGLPAGDLAVGRFDRVRAIAQF
jgi:hypothetical protein